MKTPLDLLKRQRQLLVEKLADMFIHGTEPCIVSGSIEYKWKEMNRSEDYNNGLLMLECLNRQIDENTPKPSPPPEPVIRKQY